MIGFGYGVLRLAPDAFWALTPRELALAAGAMPGRPPGNAPGRGDLDRLLALFPDRPAPSGRPGTDQSTGSTL